MFSPLFSLFWAFRGCFSVAWTGSPNRVPSFIEDQPVHVVCEIGEGEFGLDPCQPDGADEHAKAIFLVSQNMFDPGRDGRFSPLARDVASGIGLRRWMRLVNILRLGHASFAFDNRALFEGAGTEHRYLLDASTSYLSSEAAVPAILHDCSDAKFIVCERDPAAMAVSLNQHYNSKGLREPVRAFSEARAQSDAREGSAFAGSRAPAPRLLAYRHVCRIGTFVEQLLVHVDRPKVAIVVLDDLVDDPTRLCDLLEFLDLDEDIPLMFPNENRGYSLRQQWVIFTIRGKRNPAWGLAQVSQPKQRVNVDSNLSQGMGQGRI